MDRISLDAEVLHGQTRISEAIPVSVILDLGPFAFVDEKKAGSEDAL